MKYILALAGVAAGALSFVVFTASKNETDLLAAMILAGIAVLGVGTATISHAIDRHREAVEDIHKDHAEESRRRHKELLSAFLGRGT